jgi:acetate kinase
VLLYFLQHEKMSADELQHLLYEKSGLLGVSGLSADMRALLASEAAPAREAVDLFVHRVAAEVAVMANTLQGLDGLVFTGGSKVKVLVIPTSEETTIARHCAALLNREATS